MLRAKRIKSPLLPVQKQTGLNPQEACGACINWVMELGIAFSPKMP